MKRILSILLSLLAPCGSIYAETNPVIHTIAELRDALCRESSLKGEFELKATALSAPPDRKTAFVVMDKSGRIPIIDMRDTDDPHFEPGDQLLITGLIERRKATHPNDPALNANCKNVTVLSHGRPPEPVQITADEIYRDDLLHRPVRINGILIDVRKDEIDSEFLQFVIDCSNSTIYAAAYTRLFTNSLDSIKRLIGATVAFNGILTSSGGLRTHFIRYIMLHDENSLAMISSPSDDLFKAPEVGNTDRLSPETIVALGRRRVVGRVSAVWNGNTLLMHTASGEPMKASLVTSPPAVGDDIEAVGYTETDLFHVNLASVIWRKVTSASPPPDEPVLEVKTRALLVDKDGNRKFNAEYHGKTVRLRGVVQDFTSDGHSGRRIIIADGGYSIAVDLGTAPTAANGLEIGSTVSVTGICVVDTETWNRHSILPITRGIFIALRSPGDIAVLAHPPWWTPFKLMVAIGVLVVLLVAILIWNASLRILSERRGREMYRSQIAQTKAEMKTDERTRLAAELHDHLAQNLTAISYQIAAAERSYSVEPHASARHLSTASRMLSSCRTELRRCLWDLRSDALDEPDLEQAIRKSIGQVTDGVKVDIRMKVLRSKMSDPAVHTILSIIRELAANAVRHGHADRIDISGELDRSTFRFTVSDNGCGFDIASAPGIDEGHFGIVGIRERARRHGGEVSLASTIGRGTMATVTVKIFPTSSKATAEDNEKSQGDAG